MCFVRARGRAGDLPRREEAGEEGGVLRVKDGDFEEGGRAAVEAVEGVAGDGDDVSHVRGGGEGCVAPVSGVRVRACGRVRVRVRGYDLLRV